MSEDEFEQALQKYIIAVTEYRIAIERLLASDENAWARIEDAINRICYAASPPGRKSESIVTPQEEVDRRAALAQPIVDTSLIEQVFIEELSVEGRGLTDGSI